MTEEYSCYTHEYLAKVKLIPSLRMHDLLEMLQHAFSLLDGFIQYTYNYMFYNNMCNVVFFKWAHFIVISCLYVSKWN